MTSDNWQRAKDIFNSALDLDVDERQEYLSAACEGDAALRKRVEDLLSSYESNFMEAPVGIADNGKDGRLPSETMLGRYEIVRLLGSGGMGEVYLAKDKQLDRKVAIKFLSQKYESSEANLKRFIQEAKAASALNHPNILTIHEIGEADGSHFIVSEFIEGKTLRQIVAGQKLQLADILDISIQVAGALSAAHSARIIHRDIKPENIIVRSDGYVKVLDFGLAKLIPQQPSFIGLEEETIRQNQTAEGLILGTISYMSPEQARGKAVDARTDIFSLGIVIYEMIAGRTPFAGGSMPETFANLINKDPRPVSEFVAGVPDELQRVVLKMLCKKPDDRYQTMKDLLTDLKDLKEQASGRYDPISSPEHNQETAIMERTTGDLRHTTVESETSVRRYRQPKWTRGIVVTAFLTLAIAATVIIVSFYSRKPTEALNTARSPAYDLYIRGKVKVSSVNKEENSAAISLLEQAVSIDPNYAEAWAALAKAYNFRSFYFAPEAEKKKLDEDAEVAVEKALEINPNLADGHLSRGLVLWTHAKRFPHEQAVQAFKRAITLDPNSDEAHHWLGVVYLHIGLLDKALDETQKALALNPNNTRGRFRLGVIDVYSGKFEEAIAVFKTIPPDSSPEDTYRHIAGALFQLGRYNEAQKVVDQFLKDYPTDEGGAVTSINAMLLAKAGKQAEAEQAIQHAIEIGQGFGHFHHTAYSIASAYALMNKPNEALKWLQNAADDGFPCYPYFEIDHQLDNIRKDPRFIAFMSKLKKQWLKYKVEYDN
ncbi:MAG TPA: protein kinase [Pyrinomonadaceae bacterium]|nr:protein kinase [Pyrinomonadaceae bacterium]